MNYKVSYKITEIELNNGNTEYYVYDAFSTGTLVSHKSMWGQVKQEYHFKEAINWKLKEIFVTYSEAEKYIEDLIGRQVKSQKDLKFYN